MQLGSSRFTGVALAAAVCTLVSCTEDVTTANPDDGVDFASEAAGGGGGRHGGRGVHLRARLNGAAEVPAADDDGRGSARVDIDVEGGEVCFDVRFDDITTANRGHIHSGAAGINGPIVVAFFDLQTAASQRDERLDQLERKDGLDGCVSGLDPVLLADIVANPQNYYVNLHNSRFPGGAVRDQLERHGHR